MNSIQPRPAATAPGRTEVQLCTFRVSGEDFAVDIMRIREIIPPVSLTPVPEAPGYVAGVFRLRGDVVPVVDLARRLGLPPSAPTRRAKFVVVKVAGRLLGLMVDEVCEVLRLTREELRPAPAVVDGRGTRLFLGVCDGEHGAIRSGRRGGAGRLRLLLNVKALLDSTPGAGAGVESAGALLDAGRDP
jgi:purine-binding chemotaxis protein CheW